MEMDVRDFLFWIRESCRKNLNRRMDAYVASLLPHQEQGIMKSQIDDVKWQLYDLDNEGEVDDIEEAARKRYERMLEKKKLRGK